jgi:hypothetical protein
MKEGQQRIKIAEACGYSKGWDYRSGCSATPWNEWCIKSLPDYLNDLNAMHEAEATLDFEQAELFEDELYDVTFKNNNGLENPLPCRFSVCHATAAQRAEAFLKTIEKWNSNKI